MQPRPKIKIELTTADKIVELIGWILLAALVAIVVSTYGGLPGTIPTHYNISGEVDDYGDKSTLIAVAIVGIGLFFVLTYLNRYPESFNYPTKITDENAKDQYTGATRLIRYLKAILLLPFLATAIITVRAGNGETGGFGPWFIPLLIAFTLIPVLIYLVKSLSKK